MTLRYTNRAIADVELAIAWYEKQRHGLGLEFLERVETAIHSIVENPKRYGVRYHQFRGCILRRFPFWVFYTVEPQEIIVHSVFHHRQDPSKRPNPE